MILVFLLAMSMPIVPITSLSDPRIDVYRDLKGRPVSRQGDSFVVEGTKTVARLLESRYETTSILLTEARVPQWLPRLPEALPCYVLSLDLASELVGFNFHTGVVACGRRQPSPRLEDVVTGREGPLTLVICPNCDNPENLGAIIRISSGFGVDAILLGKGCCDPFSRRVLRVSMGTALRMTLVECRHLARDLARLRNEWNVELAATVLDSAAEPIKTARRGPRFGLLMGNEDTGLESEWLELCDRRLTIPMHPETDSLNVAVAAGIFLHHFTDDAPK